METKSEALSDEEWIVWTEDPASLRYVRVLACLASNRRRSTSAWDRLPGRVVGYTTLFPTAESDPDYGPRQFWRRVFWVAAHDFEGVYRTGTPVEGVDPDTLRPGHAGEITERAWGGPLPQ